MEEAGGSHVASVNVEDLLPALAIRVVYPDLDFKPVVGAAQWNQQGSTHPHVRLLLPARPQQRRVKHLPSIGHAHHQHIVHHRQAVHLCQQLIHNTVVHLLCRRCFTRVALQWQGNQKCSACHEIAHT